MSVLNTTKSVFGIFRDVIRDDLRDEPVDPAPWVNSAVYLIAMLFFGVSLWKAAVVAAIILFAIMFNYGRRTLVRGGIVVLFFTVAVWAGILPDPSKWGHLVHSMVTDIR